jgi:hypothetical protein
MVGFANPYEVATASNSTQHFLCSPRGILNSLCTCAPGLGTHRTVLCLATSLGFNKG